MLDWPAVVARHRQPSIVWSGLGLLTLMLVPAAIALACNPHAQLALNKSTYYPGDTMTISGSFFPPNRAIAVTVEGDSETVTTSGLGAFQTTLSAPAAPGMYVVTAATADGEPQFGLPKVASFQVVPAPVAPRPPAQPPVPTQPFSGNFVSDFSLRCGGRAVTLVGTVRNDVIVGRPGPDVIAALEGDDVVRGLGANDVVCGGAGNDVLSGGRGSDRLSGGPGTDRLSGGRGADRLNGGAGRDACAGGPGRDRLARCERA